VPGRCEASLRQRRAVWSCFPGRIDTDSGAAPTTSVLHSCHVPTKRPRLTITETDDVAAALDVAASRWPEVRSRRELLLRLVEQGRAVIGRDRDDAAARRREAIRRTSGALTGDFEPDHLERLRADWPV
jgi:hypothetical protein